MNYRFTGTVVSGNKIGRRLGFPTANMELSESVLLRNGVYAGTVTAEGSTYRAMVNVGYKPSVGLPSERTLEAHLFDFDGDLYGKPLEVELLEFIRPEERFDSLEKLKEQIGEDRKRILHFFETTGHPLAEKGKSGKGDEA